MIAYNLFYKAHFEKQIKNLLRQRPIIDQIAAAVVRKLHFSNARARTLALHLRSFHCRRQKHLYVWHSCESVPLDSLSRGIRNHRSMKSENCQPAKGPSLSTCCGTGCYKHLSNLNWVCNTVMFPSRCYLPASGTAPCTQGGSAGRNTYTISHSHTHTRIHELEKYKGRWRKGQTESGRGGRMGGWCLSSLSLTRWALFAPRADCANNIVGWWSKRKRLWAIT